MRAAKCAIAACVSPRQAAARVVARAAALAVCVADVMVAKARRNARHVLRHHRRSSPRALLSACGCAVNGEFIAARHRGDLNPCRQSLMDF